MAAAGEPGSTADLSQPTTEWSHTHTHTHTHRVGFPPPRDGDSVGSYAQVLFVNKSTAWSHGIWDHLSSSLRVQQEFQMLLCITKTVLVKGLLTTNSKA